MKNNSTYSLISDIKIKREAASVFEHFQISRLEFLVTKNCNSQCEHCSVIPSETGTDYSFSDMSKLEAAIEKIMDLFAISSVMTYGGEPLLFPGVTIRLHETFKSRGVEERELITNGFFDTVVTNVQRIARSLVDSGITKILLSVDTFHQKHIPIMYIETFIECIVSTGFRNILLHPAWLVSKDNRNEYNDETHRILDGLKTKFDVSVSNGNIIVPVGSSRKLLGAYYKKSDLDLNRPCGVIPYTNSLINIKNLRFLPNGNVNICRGVCIGNIFENDIETILNNYSPFSNPITSILLSGGIGQLLKHVGCMDDKIKQQEYFGVCDLCTDCIQALTIMK